MCGPVDQIDVLYASIYIYTYTHTHTQSSIIQHYTRIQLTCFSNLFCRHEKVQENCIDLVGRIADRGAEFVPAKEWMRICFELLELLKAHKKAIRRATVNTFGYIAKAIG